MQCGLQQAAVGLRCIVEDLISEALVGCWPEWGRTMGSHEPARGLCVVADLISEALVWLVA